MKKTILMATIICVLFFVMSSMCFADDVIHGCVGKFTGILRVVSSTSKCLPIESPISWNIQGPQGLQGVQGLPGVANGITAVMPTLTATVRLCPQYHPLRRYLEWTMRRPRPVIIS